MNNLHYLFKAIPWLGFFAAITLSWIFYLRARNKERLALIEKGVDIEKLFAAPSESNRVPWLKLGVIIIGICIGVLLAFMLIVLFPDSIIRDAILFLMVIFGLLFGGIGMLISSKFDRNRQNKK